MKPHRGVLILVLGILGLVGCCICAPIAWYMGSQDMAEIEAGRMDPEGKQMTQIGMILGIVGCVLTLSNATPGIAASAGAKAPQA